MITGGYYIKARKIQDSEIAFAPPHVREIWDWLIKEVNHKDCKNFKRGQTLRTIKDIQNGLSWFIGYRKMTYKKHNCEMALNWLRKRDMITTMKTTRGMIITINKYSTYQDPKNYESNNEKTTKATTKQQMSDTINKNDKNNNKLTVEETFELFWNKYHNITKLEKTDKVPAIKYWKKLNLEEQRKAYIMIENYFNSINDKKYIKKARTYLSDKDFDNEFEVKIKTKNPNIVKVSTEANGTKKVAGVIIDGLSNDEILKIWLNRDKEKYK